MRAWHDRRDERDAIGCNNDAGGWASCRAVQRGIKRVLQCPRAIVIAFAVIGRGLSAGRRQELARQPAARAVRGAKYVGRRHGGRSTWRRRLRGPPAGAPEAVLGQFRAFLSAGVRTGARLHRCEEALRVEHS